MNKIKKIALQIIADEIDKCAAENNKIFNIMNQKFNDFIKNDFKSTTLNKKVPYVALPANEKELVWKSFLNKVWENFLSKELQTEPVQEII